MVASFAPTTQSAERVLVKFSFNVKQTPTKDTELDGAADQHDRRDQRLYIIMRIDSIYLFKFKKDADNFNLIMYNIQLTSINKSLLYNETILGNKSKTYINFVIFEHHV